jgi:carboxyl-terminal processing protease
LVAPLFGFTTVFGIVDGQATVVGLAPDSPLGRAGVKPEDRILEINGREIAGLDADAIVEALRPKPGTRCSMVVARGVGDVFRIEVTAP